MVPGPLVWEPSSKSFISFPDFKSVAFYVEKKKAHKAPSVRHNSPTVSPRPWANVQVWLKKETHLQHDVVVSERGEQKPWRGDFCWWTCCCRNHIHHPLFTSPHCQREFSGHGFTLTWDPVVKRQRGRSSSFSSSWVWFFTSRKETGFSVLFVSCSKKKPLKTP